MGSTQLVPLANEPIGNASMRRRDLALRSSSTRSTNSRGSFPNCRAPQTDQRRRPHLTTVRVVLILEIIPIRVSRDDLRKTRIYFLVGIGCDLLGLGQEVAAGPTAVSTYGIPARLYVPFR